MSVGVFYNPDLVDRLEACGITRRRSLNGAPTRGFVLRTSEPRAPGGRSVTNVIAVHGPVTITAPQLRLPAGEATTPATAADAPRTALELAEECSRLRRDNQRLSDEVARLRAEVGRLTAGTSTPRQQEPIDDAGLRFTLLELDL